MAHGILEHLSDVHGLGWTIDSAGTESFHVGEAPHKYSQQVCKEKGIDISAQRARQFKLSDLEQFDLIYAMADDVLQNMKRIAGSSFDGSKIKLFLEELYPNEQRNVKDPWYGNLDGYYEVFDEIELCCKAIIARYGTQS